MRNKVFVFLILANFCSVWASDVKVKLNSVGGATSFQVMDSAGVVVSSITSAGDAVFATVTTTHTITAGSDIRVKGNDIHFGESQTDRKIYDDPATYSTRFSSNVYIESGALRDRTVESGDLIVTSTAAYSTSDQDVSVNSWTDLTGLYANLNVTAQPAMIFVSAACTLYRVEANNLTKGGAMILIDETAVAFGEAQGGNNAPQNIALAGGLRVTSTGDYVVKVQGRSGDSTGAWGTERFYGRSMNAFWVGCQ